MTSDQVRKSRSRSAKWGDQTQELPQAWQAWQQALAICDDLNHHWAEAYRAKLASTQG
jgi:hypothetical protein